VKAVRPIQRRRIIEKVVLLIAQSVKHLATRVRRPKQKKSVAGDPATTFPLRPALTFPTGYDEPALYAFVSSVRRSVTDHARKPDFLYRPAELNRWP